jgi:hypothetical protein
MVRISVKNGRTGTPNTPSFINHVEKKILDVQEVDGKIT